MSALTQWTALVQRQGGVVTAWPLSPSDTRASWPGVALTTALEGGYGSEIGREVVQDPAVRFPVLTYENLFNTGQIDPTLPQTVSADGQNAYVLAPADVRANAAALTPYNAATDPANPMPLWYTRLRDGLDALGLGNLGTVALWGGAGLVGLLVLTRRR